MHAEEKREKGGLKAYIEHNLSLSHVCNKNRTMEETVKRRIQASLVLIIHLIIRRDHESPARP